MAPVQKTFSLIPELPSALNGGEQGRVTRPPMTTRQAKKAYKAKNKGPKLSKAEQRRQDLMEQDRIRREFEKERNQARAKAARDKRKEKEEREKSEKKRKGLPLSEVHPSQDTLARFVRKPPPFTTAKEPDVGIKRIQTRETTAEIDRTTPPLVEPAKVDDSDRTLSGDDEPKRPTKRQRFNSQSHDLPRMEKVPGNMFKKPKPEQLELKVVQTTAAPKPDVGSGRNTMFAAKPTEFDPDDPTVERMVQQQVLIESFSADDGLFDGIDFDALEVGNTAQEVTHVHKDVPPPKPPDLSLDIVEKNRGSAKPVNISQRTIDVDSTSTDESRGSAISRDNRPPEEETQIAVESREEKPRKDLTTPKSHGDIRRNPVTSQPRKQCAAQPLERGFRAATHVAADTVEAERQARPPLSAIPLNTALVAEHDESPTRPTTRVIEKQQSAENTPKAPVQQQRHTVFSKPAPFRSPRTPVMGPPPLPPRFKTVAQTTPVNKTNKPKFLPQQRSSCDMQSKTPRISGVATEAAMDVLPSSTQLFLLSNADQLFPSPSQEVAEIFSKPTKVANHNFVRPRTAPAPLKFMPPSRSDRPKTATEASRTTIPKTAAPASFSPHKNGTYVNRLFHVDSKVSPVQLQHPILSSIDYMPFLSTQDVILSSQDLEELGQEPVKAERILGPSKYDPSLNRPDTSSAKTNQGTRKNKELNLTPTTEHNRSLMQPLLGISTDQKLLGSLPSQFRNSLPESPSRPQLCEKNVYSEYTHLADSLAAPELFNKGDTTLESSFTDDEIAELISSDIETEQNASGPAEPEKTSDIPRQQAPVGPRPSPKPFFTSSGTKEKFYLAIEKTKTTAWKDKGEHRKAQDDLDVLLREQDEKQERFLLERMLEAEEQAAQQPMPNSSDDHPNERAHSSPRSSGGDRRSRSQQSTTTTSKSRQRSHPQSSWEKLRQRLAESNQEEISPAPQENNSRVDPQGLFDELPQPVAMPSGSAVITGSQESDYGDMAWDADDLADLQ